MNEVKLLTWDSDFFDVRVGEATLQNSGAGISGNGFDVIYVKSVTDPDIPITGFSPSFKEEKIVYSKALTPSEPEEEKNIVPFTAYANRESLYGLAYESGKFSRFFLDPKFGRQKFEELYRAWVNNSVQGTIADGVLTYMEAGIPVGMITYKVHGTYAQVGIFGVRDDRQGQGIGRRLLQHLEAGLVADGVETLRIPTQAANRQACQFYERMGYEVAEKNSITHYWKV